MNFQELIINEIHNSELFKAAHKVKRKKARGYSIRLEYFLYNEVKEAYKNKLNELHCWFVSQQLEEVREILSELRSETQNKKYIIYTDNIKQFKNKKDEGEEIVYVIPFFYTTL